MQKSEQTKTIEKNRKGMLDSYAYQASSIFDAGTSISSNFVPNRKAQIIINMLANKHIGYKVAYNNLINKQWKKWTWELRAFSQTEMLKPNDIKEAIKGFYIAVKNGTLSFKDNVQKMLVFEKTRINEKTFIYELKVVEFKEVFKIIENQEKQKKQKTIENGLKELLEIASTEQEKFAIEQALKALSSKLIKKAS